MSCTCTVDSQIVRRRRPSFRRVQMMHFTASRRSGGSCSSYAIRGASSSWTHAAVSSFSSRPSGYTRESHRCASIESTRAGATPTSRAPRSGPRVERVSRVQLLSAGARARFQFVRKANYTLVDGHRYS